MEWKISKKPVEYPEALDFMDARVADIHEGRADECVWLLEHPALYTGGTSAKADDLLDAGGLPVYETGRGGEYTYHGPGQRVAYVMVDLKRRQKGPDIKRYVWQLEEWIIQALAEFGIAGERREGRVGIWVKTPHPSFAGAQDTLSRGEREGPTQWEGEGIIEEEKIAAIGVRVRRWVTLHGIAINVAPDLSHFSGIVPCGISEHGVTSMQALGVDASMEEVDRVLREKFGEVF
ncbi:MAG TPA: lipoyl(octanoyl) transferase LipB [Alphaproteobacteria bacterium]|nr:MAG: lipoyl(octanoyl) transferase LipB [Rhodospirillales bacterium]HOO81159.1 lipoyl(octanoyl) transferase LipB [Alphaproteobacteria bacterium]